VLGGIAGQGAFSNCSALEYFEMPSTVLNIGEYAFQGCGALKYNIINAGCQTIGGRAFQACFKTGHVTDIHIPGSVHTIDDFAFSYVGEAVESVTFGGLADPTQIKSFASTPNAFCQDPGSEIATLYYYSNTVPNSVVEAALNDLNANGDQWSDVRFFI
jgi:hypothetical protein